MSEWERLKLGDLTKLITKGTTPNKSMGGFVSNGINYIKSESISYDGRIDSTKFNFITEETHSLLKRSQLGKDDILFSMAGAYLGKSAIVLDYHLPANTNQALAIIRLNQSKASSKFINYFFRNPSVIEYVNNLSGQSAQPNINFEEIKSIEINLPPLPEQQAIASVLSSLDDKIDLLHRQNKTLEAMAETLFRHWFIEEAKEDWEEILITDLFEVKDGTHDSPKQSEVGFHLITSKHIHNGQIDFDSAYLVSNIDYEKINQRSKVEQFDILFSMIGTLGLIYIEMNEKVDYAIKNIGLFKTSQNPKWCYFLYLWLKSSFGNEFIEENKSGSTQEYISLGSLRKINFKVPNVEKIDVLNSAVDKQFNKIFANKKQIQTLENLRDTLLPKLMSGEIRVQH